MASKRKQPLLNRLFNNWPVKILSLAAAVILFMFHRISTLEERYISVPLKIVTTTNLVPSTTYPRVVRLTLRGEGSALAAILEEDIDVYADFSKQRGEGVYRAPIQVKRRGTAANISPLETRVDPPEIMVGLESKLAKTVPVVPGFKGYMEPGYELTEYKISPSVVEITGPRSLIEKISDISTDQIELTGRKEDFDVRISLVKSDPLITIQGDDQVDFSGKVLESVVLKTFDGVPVGAVNLGRNFAIGEGMPTVSLKVQGSQKDIASFQPDASNVNVDCSAIREPGTYTLPVNVSLPANLAVLRHDPAEVSFRVVASTRGQP